MAFPSKNDWGLLWYGGALAIILTKSNSGQGKKIKPILGSFFANAYGVFKIDTMMQYYHGKQPIFIYNSHSEKIDKKIVKNIYKLYHKRKDKELVTYLKSKFEYIDDRETSLEDCLGKIVDKQQHYPIDIDTDKYLPFFYARKPAGTKMLAELANEGQKEIDDLYPRLKVPIPIVAVLIGVMIFLVVMQDIPSWLRQAQDAITGGLGSAIGGT